MSYGRIRRGPMAADSFTQIRNAVFRDVRLSAKAMGIFGNISTHRDGWGVSAESIASQMKDGVAAVKAGLRELEEYGYLQRTRRRNPDGTLGSSVYFITDQPEALPGPPELESRRSEPAVDFPPVANPPVDRPPEVEPPVAEPTVANRPHKNTNSKHTKSQNTLSPRLPRQQAQEPPASDEREINDDEQMVLAAYTRALGRKPTTAVAQKICDQTAKLIADGLPAWWIADRAKELPNFGTDLAKHCEMSSIPVETIRPADAQKVCDRGHDQFDPMIRDPERGLVNCPDCHPAEIARRRRLGAA